MRYAVFFVILAAVLLLETPRSKLLDLLAGTWGAVKAHNHEEQLKQLPATFRIAAFVGQAPYKGFDTEEGYVIFCEEPIQSWSQRDVLSWTPAEGGYITIYNTSKGETATGRIVRILR